MDRWSARRPMVSIHASAREATAALGRTECEGLVSIHASAREATRETSIDFLRRSVSIHASAREATPQLPRGAHPCRLFRSTPPRGRRPPRRVLRPHRNSFDPRLRAGGDHPRPLCSSGRKCFDPRLRAGGDSRISTRRSADSGFDPRLRAGGDGRHRFACGSIIIVSIHASAREATRSRVASRCGDAGFDPRLRAGGDLRGDHDPGQVRVSIHASAREATIRAGVTLSAQQFRSTPPRGRRLSCCDLAMHRQDVSIHASAREATRTFEPARRGRHGFDPRLRAGGDV